MITDARVLQETFVPHEVRHRDSEVDAIAGSLRPLMEEEEQRGEHTFLYGPSGSGKTCIARYVLEQLKQHRIDLQTAYVNCWEHYNRFRVLYTILEAAGKTLDIHRQSTPKDELLERVRDLNQPFALILDEVDQLEERKVLYDLYSMPHITLVLIANTEHDFFAQLGERIRSRFMSAKRIAFNQYGHRALVQILSDRIEWGLQPDVIAKGQIERVADAAAGDARIAIGILRAAARRAQEEREGTITDDIIDEVIPQAEHNEEKKNLERLNKHQRVLYEVIREVDEIQPKTLYQRYEDRVNDPKSRRTLRTYLQKMEHYDLIEAQGAKKGRTYRVP